MPVYLPYSVVIYYAWRQYEKGGVGMLSVVIPAFNEEEMLQKTADTVRQVLAESEIDFEIIFVDDGSSDSTWEKIEEICHRSERVRGIRFSRNFGKESAIFAGLEQVRGECAAVMDCDLQHPPEALVNMYRLWENGYEIVEGKKKSRGRESALHGLCASAFYGMMSKAAGVDMKGASDFKLLDRKAVDALLRMPERSVFFRGMSSWIGFRKAEVQFDVREREAGQSKWGIFRLIRYAIRNIAGYSSAPLQTVTGAGLLFLVLTLVLGAQTLISYFRGKAVEGFTTVILLVLFTGSIVMISLGIIGYYVAKIYDEIKGRPRYVISESTSGRRKEEVQSVK